MNLELAIMGATRLPLQLIIRNIMPFVRPGREKAANMIRKCWLRKMQWSEFKVDCHVFERALYPVETLHYGSGGRTPVEAYRLYLSEWSPVASRSRPGKTSWRHKSGSVVRSLDMALSDAVLMKIFVETWNHSELRF